ncbi:hypothetical protein D9M69_636570 [compost metagenome]
MDVPFRGLKEVLEKAGIGKVEPYPQVIVRIMIANKEPKVDPPVHFCLLQDRPYPLPENKIC